MDRRDLTMKHTNATKKKLSEMRKGEKNPFFGKKHSDETKAKMADCTREMNAARQYDLSPVSITVPTDERVLYYLAGIIDGEGSIGMVKNRPVVSIYNTDERLMRWVVEVFGGNYSRADERGRVACFTWRISAARDVYALCSALADCLLIKAVRCRAVVKYLEGKYGERIKN